MNVISFDIETIPQREPLNKAQEEEFQKVFTKYMERTYPDSEYTDEQSEEAKRLLMSVSPYLGEICVIGTYFVKDDGSLPKEHAFFGDEKTILNEFWSALRDFDDTRGIYVSFNGLSFDVPFILKRSMKHRVLPTKSSFLNLRRFSTNPHFDVKEVITDYSKFVTGNLDLITSFLDIESPKEGKIKAADVAQAYNDGKIDEIAEYCLRDVKSTYEVYKVLSNYIYTPPKKNWQK